MKEHKVGVDSEVERAWERGKTVIKIHDMTSFLIKIHDMKLFLIKKHLDAVSFLFFRLLL